MKPEEKETIIQYGNASENAVVYTCSRGLANYLEKHGYVCGQKDKNGGRTVAWWFKVPKDRVKIRPPKRKRISRPRAA